MEGPKGGVLILSGVDTIESGHTVDGPGGIFSESPVKGNRKEISGFGVDSKKPLKIWSVKNSLKISSTLQEETRKDLGFSFAPRPEEIGGLRKVSEENPDRDMDSVSPQFIVEAKRTTNAHFDDRGNNSSPDTGFLQYGTFFDPDTS